MGALQKDYLQLSGPKVEKAGNPCLRIIFSFPCLTFMSKEKGDSVILLTPSMMRGVPNRHT
jgi:hypothetical protein